MDHKDVKHGALIELRNSETGQWLPLSIISIVFDTIECRTLQNEPIFTTTSALIKGARLRPPDGSCRACGDKAHEGPCIDRQCSKCGVPVNVSGEPRPKRPVHVYRLRKLAEIAEAKPYPTREQNATLQRDLIGQLQTLRNAKEVHQGKVMLSELERVTLMRALENAALLIDALPREKRKGS